MRQPLLTDESNALSKLTFEEGLLALLECTNSRCLRSYSEVDRMADACFPNHRTKRIGWETAEIMTRNVGGASATEVGELEFWRKLMEKSHQALQKGYTISNRNSQVYALSV